MHLVNQSVSYLPCYALAKESDQAICLFEYNPDEMIWQNIGSTGCYHLKSIAIDSESSIIYAVDKHTLGKINPVTG